MKTLTPEQIESNLAAYRHAMESGSAEGIEARNRISHTWESLRLPAFGINDLYRIKPAPKLRPWTPEEAIGKCVRHKTVNGLFQITLADHDGANLGGGLRSHSYKELLAVCEQLDGSPCGVME